MSRKATKKQAVKSRQNPSAKAGTAPFSNWFPGDVPKPGVFTSTSLNPFQQLLFSADQIREFKATNEELGELTGYSRQHVGEARGRPEYKYAVFLFQHNATKVAAELEARAKKTSVKARLEAERKAIDKLTVLMDSPDDKVALWAAQTMFEPAKEARKTELVAKAKVKAGVNPRDPGGDNVTRWVTEWGDTGEPESPKRTDERDG